MSIIDKLIREPLAEVQFIIEKKLPMWSITYFLERICLNHLKLVSIQRICELKSFGINDDQFIVIADSADIIPKSPFIETQFKNKIVYGTKETTEEFWFIIKRYKRPIVLIDYNHELIPLYDFNYPEAAKIKYYEEKSPIKIGLGGLASAFCDLIYGAEREKREVQTHKLNSINKATNNIKDIISAHEIINRNNVPDGVKRYAINVLQNILENQIELNKEIGIMDEHIDIKI